MPDLNGISFGGSVWSYGSLDSFRHDYEIARQELSRNEATELKPLEKPKNEPVDTGMTRYLGKTGDSELKWANLDKINLYVDKFKLDHDGALPEAKDAKDLVDRNKLGKMIFGDENVADVTRTLARLLEKKTLEAKCLAAGNDKVQLTPEEREKISKTCATALDKTMLAAAIKRAEAELGDNAVTSRVLGDRDTVLNTALGVAELMMDGKINADAVVTLVRDGALVDLTNDLDVTRMLQDAAIQAKEEFTQEKALLAAMEKNGVQPGSDTYRSVKALINARKQFTRVLDFKIHDHDPKGKLDDATFLKAQLQDVKLRLQQFRYDLDRCTSNVGTEFGHRKFGFYGIMEKIRRACSNQCGDRHLDVRFGTDADRKEMFSVLQRAERDAGFHLDALGLGDKSLSERAHGACNTTHEANNAARLNQNVGYRRRAWTEYGNKVLDMMRETGGMRAVITEVSVSALMEFGADGLVEAHASVGGFCKTSATLVVNKEGGFSLVLSKVGGIRGGGGAGAAGPTAKTDLTGEISHGKETTLPFKNREDLIAFCRKNAPKLLQSIPGALILSDGKTVKREALPRFYSAVGIFKKAGKFLGNVLGLRIHKSKNFSEIGFEQKMRDKGVFKNLDGMLASRRNAVAMSRIVQSVTGAEVTGSANVSVSEAGNVGVKGNVGGAYRKGKFKTLKTAQQAFVRHTAAEMRANVLDAEFAAFEAYMKKDLPKADMSAFVNRMKDFMTKRPPDNAGPDERAQFWRTQVSKMTEKYGGLESVFLNPKGDEIKSKDDQKLFAHCTRLCAVVSEYVAKVIEEDLAATKDVKGTEKAQQGISIALREAREGLGSRLARPRVGLDFNVFQSIVQFGKEINIGKTWELHTSLEANWQLGASGTGGTQATGASSGGAGSLKDMALATFKKTFTETIPNQYKDFGKTFLDKLLLQSGRVSGKLTGQFHTGENGAVMPWMKSDSLQFDLEIDKPMSPISLLETVVKLVDDSLAKGVGEKSVADKLKASATQLAVELAKQAASTALNEVDKSLSKIVTTSPLMTVPLMTLMGGLNKALGLVGVNIGMPSIKEVDTKGCKLTLRFEGDGFTQCKVSDYVQNVKSMDVKIKAGFLPFSIGVSKKDISRQELTQFETLPNPSLDSMLSRCADLLGANGDAGVSKVKTFLLKNQGATNRLVKDLRTCDGPGGGLSYKNATLESMRRDLASLKRLAETPDAKVPAKLKKSAQALHDRLFGDPAGVWTKIAAAPEDPALDTDETRAELMKNFALAVLGGYGLLSEAQEVGWA